MADNSISSNKIMSTRSLWRLGATHASCIWRAKKAISANFSPLSFKDEDAIVATHPHEIDHRSLVISESTRALQQACFPGRINGKVARDRGPSRI